MVLSFFFLPIGCFTGQRAQARSRSVRTGLNADKKKNFSLQIFSLFFIIWKKLHGSESGSGNGRKGHGSHEVTHWSCRGRRELLTLNCPLSYTTSTTPGVQDHPPGVPYLPAPSCQPASTEEAQSPLEQTIMAPLTLEMAEGAEDSRGRSRGRVCLPAIGEESILDAIMS